MNPKSFLRELVYPATEMSVILAIIVFTLLFTLAAAAGFFGFWLLVVLVPAWFRYLLYLLEARANGRAAPVPTIEMFNPAENFWSLFPLVLLAVIVWGAWLLATSVSVTAAIVYGVSVFLLVPASMALLAITRSPLESLNPTAIMRLLRECSGDYLLIIAQFGLTSVLLFGLAVIGTPDFVIRFASIYQAALLFTFTGAVLHANKIALQVDIPDALEPDEAAIEKNLLKQRQGIANHAYGFVSRGNRAGGLQHIQSWIDSDPDPDDAYRWFFLEILKWESSDAALFFAQTWLSRLLRQQENVEALKLVARCLLQNPQFRPLEEDRERVRELARQANHEDLLRQLD